MTKPCIVTALPVESKCLVDNYRLSFVKTANLNLYDGDKVRLLQCGLGKLSAAASVNLFLHLYPRTTSVINVGIAGADLPIGTVVMAHTVRDKGSDRKWYPHLPESRNSPKAELKEILTVDKPCDEYKSEFVYDMEASGIFSAACPRLNTALVHSVKVISDNVQNSWTALSKNKVPELMLKTIPSIDQLLLAMASHKTIDQAATTALFDELVSILHFTQTEQHALKDKLQRLTNLLGEPPSAASLLDLKNAKKIHAHLDAKLDGVAPTY